MTQPCHFCGNHIIETIPVKQVGESWIDAGQTAESFEWSCRSCLEKQ